MRPSPPPPDGLPRSQGLDAAMRRILSRPLSATRLDVYQQCPQRFVWQCLCRLAPPAEVNEGDDPAAVGICIHETLRALFTPYLGRECRRGDISRETLLACFADALEKADLRRQLPPDSCLLLEEAAPERLWQFLRKQPESTVIEALEAPLAAALDLAGQRYAFKGVMDRLDRRDGFLLVLDYKTGTLKRHESGLWTDIAPFRQAEGICEQARLGPLGHDGMESLDALFAQLQGRLPSLQLPAYLLMAEAAGLSPLADAALVDLRESGEERPLFGGLVDEDLAAALRHCRLALGVTLLHMRYAPRFTACRGDACQWCPYSALCAGRG